MNLTELAARLGEELHRLGAQVTTAESCTGGGIAEAITRIAGSSAWFEAGYVTYSNAQKTRQLGVPAALFMALLKFVTEREIPGYGADPGAYLERLNLLLRNQKPILFVSSIYGFVDFAAGGPDPVLAVAGAAYPHPLLSRAPGGGVATCAVAISGAIGSRRRNTEARSSTRLMASSSLAASRAAQSVLRRKRAHSALGTGPRLKM